MDAAKAEEGGEKDFYRGMSLVPPDSGVEGAGQAVINGLTDKGGDVCMALLFLGVTLTDTQFFCPLSFTRGHAGMFI